MWHSSTTYVTVTTSGVPVRATSAEADASARRACQTVFIQQRPANTGVLYVCDRSDADITTGLGVLAQIPAPVLNADSIATSLPCAVVSAPDAPAPFDAAEFWIDADNDGDVALVSIVVR